MINGVKESYTIRTSHHAVSTANAPFSVYKHDTALSLVSRTNRAHLDAGWIVTLIAELGHKEGLLDILCLNLLKMSQTQVNLTRSKTVSCSLWCVGPSLTVLCYHVSFNPCSSHVGIIRNLILGLTCLYAQAATNTLIGIYQKNPPNPELIASSSQKSLWA